MKFPPVVLIGVDACATGTTGLAVLGLGDVILGAVSGIEHAILCPELCDIEHRLSVLSEPIHVAIGIEYPRFNGRGGGAATVRAAANAWQRVLLERFPRGTPGLLRLWVFFIDPNDWQRQLLGDRATIKAMGTKRLSLMRVNQLLGIRCEDHNIADAVCLAEFTRSAWQSKFIAGARKGKARHLKRGKRHPTDMIARVKRAAQLEQDADSDIE